MDRIEFGQWLEALDAHPGIEEIDFMVGFAIGQGQTGLEYMCADCDKPHSVPDEQWHGSVVKLMECGFIKSLVHVPVEENVGVYGEHIFEFTFPTGVVR